MKRIEQLTKEELLSFNSGDIWKNYLNSFSNEFKEALQEKINEQVKTKQKFQILIQTNFGNFSEDLKDLYVVECGIDGFILKIGNMPHSLTVGFTGLNTDRILVDFLSEGNNTDPVYVEKINIFSEPMLVICSDWLLTQTLPDNFYEQVKENEGYLHFS